MYAPLTPGSCAVLGIDLQRTLLGAVREGATVEANALRILNAARVFTLPLRLSTQYARGLGPLAVSIRKEIGDDEPVYDKSHFSCFEDPDMAGALARLSETGRRRLLILGVEAHVCVYQSALGALEHGFDVTVITDAVASRTDENRRVALDRMAKLGAHLASTEMVIFELLGRAGTSEFKALQAQLK